MRFPIYVRNVCFFGAALSMLFAMWFITGFHSRGAAISIGIFIVCVIVGLVCDWIHERERNRHWTTKYSSRGART